MIAVIQRVRHSSVIIKDSLNSIIGKGLLVLLGVVDGDTKKDADKLIKKIPNLRIFEDEAGKMNLSCLDIEGEILLVSQFTLCADCSNGRSPNFEAAAKTARAEELYAYCIQGLEEQGIKGVQTGVFGADMQVDLLNEGPVTIILDSKEL